MNLSGQIALVTGGGTGIGKAIAKAMLAEGAKVIIVGRKEEILKSLSNNIKLLKSLPKKEEYVQINKTGYDVSDLTPKQQQILFLGNLIRILFLNNQILNKIKKLNIQVII